MSRISCALIVTLVGCLLVDSTPAQEKASADEKPAQAVKGFGSVVDPDGDCQIQEQIKVTITVPKTTHDLTYRADSDYNKQNAPRIVQDAKGDFQLAIKVESFVTPKEKASTNGRNCHVSAGLLVWQDDHNFIRLERAASGGPPKPWVHAERFEDGKSVSLKKLTIDDKDTYLRATRIGNNFTFETSEDGQGWTKLQTAEIKLAEQLKVGVMAINTSIEDFSATLEAPKPNQGEK